MTRSCPSAVRRLSGTVTAVTAVGGMPGYAWDGGAALRLAVVKHAVALWRRVGHEDVVGQVLGPRAGGVHLMTSDGRRVRARPHEPSASLRWFPCRPPAVVWHHRCAFAHLPIRGQLMYAVTSVVPVAASPPSATKRMLVVTCLIRQPSPSISRAQARMDSRPASTRPRSTRAPRRPPSSSSTAGCSTTPRPRGSWGWSRSRSSRSSLAP